MRRFGTSLFVAGVMLFVFSSQVTANDVMDLNTLKSKYGVGAAKIERSAYVAYTNAICSLMQQFKSKGDLDAYLVLQNEQKALANMPIIPTGEVRDNLSAKVQGYKEIMTKLETDRDQQLSTLRKQYIVRLEALLKELMTSDRIDEAKRVKDEKDTILLLVKQQSAKDGAEMVANSTPPVPQENQSLPPAVTELVKIPADAVAYNGHRYLLVKEPATWEAAKKTCEEMGGHLLILDDDAELKFVMQDIMADPDVYIGASFDGLRWRWLNGKPLDKTRYQLPPRSEVSAVLSGNAYQGMAGRVKGVYNGIDGQHLYVCEWEGDSPADDKANGKIPAVDRGQAGVTKQDKELIITKATLVGSGSPIDITALLQERVENGKLEISDVSFLRDKYGGIYGYGRNNRAVIIQYKFNRGMVKSVRIKYGDPITIVD